MTLIEGLEGDRAALVLKLHHSLTDGVGAVQLGFLLFELTPEMEPVVPVEDVGPEPVPSGPELTREALARSVRSMVSTARGGVGRIVPTATTTVRHPLRSTLDVLATASSLGRFVMPVSDTLSPIMRRRGLGRHLDMIEVEVDDLKAAGAAVGSTLNDAFVASVTGGLRRYHALHGASVKDLRVTMPISMRRESDPVGGNRITLERFTVPVGEADPGARVRMTGWLCRAARYEEALPLSDTVAGVLNLLPSGVVGSMLKHVDFVASDVPGVPVDLYLAGAPVTGYYAFGPTTGAALNVTLVSYRGTCCIGVNIDTAAVPDAGVLVDCLRQGFDEVLGRGGRAPSGDVAPGRVRAGRRAGLRPAGTEDGEAARTSGRSTERTPLRRARGRSRPDGSGQRSAAAVDAAAGVTTHRKALPSSRAEGRTASRSPAGSDGRRSCRRAQAGRTPWAAPTSRL